MTYVYVLESLKDPRRRYTGLTCRLGARLREHDEGRSYWNSRYRPWRLVGVVGFDDPGKAAAFERYLKSGSGHAFASKHFR